MIDAEGHPRVMDFGLAKPERSSSHITLSGTVVGTPAYMSPEQIQGQTIDRRTDIFSTGILLYELLTGKKPFQGTQWVLQKSIVEDDPAWPSTLVQIPPEIDRVVAHALAKQAERRFQSARKFADALKRILDGKAPEEPGEAPFPTKAAAPPPAPAKAGAAASATGTEAEKEFWDEVKDSTDPDDVALYLEQFPTGTFAAQAQKKVAELRAKKG
jgi:serine/threonine-protein kinase